MNPFVAFEVFTIGLITVALLHAWRRGTARVFELTAATAYGVILEIITIVMFNAYRYGDFNVMIFDVPLAIGLGWGVIIYTSMLTSDALPLPEWIRPLSDALLALNIDLAMDVISIRLDYWTWLKGDMIWFGVPSANFAGWFLVVWSFSSFLRLFRRTRVFSGSFVGRVIYPFVSLALSVAVLEAILYYAPINVFTVFGTVVASLAIVLLAAFWTSQPFKPMDPVAFWIPAAIHVYFLAFLIYRGMYEESIFILGVAAAMLGIHLAIHSWPKRWVSRRTSL